MANRDASSPLGTVPKGVSEYGWGAAGYQSSGLPTKYVCVCVCVCVCMGVCV
jgi:hypothetical protein